MRKLALACVVALLSLPAVAQVEPPLLTHLITPCRYLDTRIPGCIPGEDTNCPQGPFTNGQTRLYLVQKIARCPMGSEETPIPPGAKGLLVTVIATGATAPGSLLLYSAFEAPRPTATTLNFTVGVNTANTTIVALTRERPEPLPWPLPPDLAVYAWVPGGTVHVVLDLVGYLAP